REPTGAKLRRQERTRPMSQNGPVRMSVPWHAVPLFVLAMLVGPVAGVAASFVATSGYLVLVAWLWAGIWAFISAPPFFRYGRHRWAEVDGAVLRTCDLWTGQVREHSVFDIREVVPLTELPLGPTWPELEKRSLGKGEEPGLSGFVGPAILNDPLVEGV